MPHASKFSRYQLLKVGVMHLISSLHAVAVTAVYRFSSVLRVSLQLTLTASAW